MLKLPLGVLMIETCMNHRYQRSGRSNVDVAKSSAEPNAAEMLSSSFRSFMQ